MDEAKEDRQTAPPPPGAHPAFCRGHTAPPAYSSSPTSSAAAAAGLLLGRRSSLSWKRKDEASSKTGAALAAFELYEAARRVRPGAGRPDDPPATAFPRRARTMQPRRSPQTMQPRPSLPPATSIAPSAAAAAGSLLLPKRAKAQGDILPNGLTFYVVHNAKPKGEVRLRLIVKAGSANEEEDERGIAHLVEHLVFAGTENFQEESILASLQAAGLTLGADCNATTSFQCTWYDTIARTGADAELDRALALLADFAVRAFPAGGAVTDARIDKERSIVLEEMRQSLSADSRAFAAMWDAWFAGEPYERRLPIGTRECVLSCPADRIRRWYRRWYVPERMAVVVCGDLATQAKRDSVEARIRTHFSGLRPHHIHYCDCHGQHSVVVDDDDDDDDDDDRSIVRDAVARPLRRMLSQGRELDPTASSAASLPRFFALVERDGEDIMTTASLFFAYRWRCPRRLGTRLEVDEAMLSFITVLLLQSRLSSAAAATGGGQVEVVVHMPGSSADDDGGGGSGGGAPPTLCGELSGFDSIEITAVHASSTAVDAIAATATLVMRELRLVRERGFNASEVRQMAAMLLKVYSVSAAGSEQAIDAFAESSSKQQLGMLSEQFRHALPAAFGRFADDNDAAMESARRLASPRGGGHADMRRYTRNALSAEHGFVACMQVGGGNQGPGVPAVTEEDLIRWWQQVQALDISSLVETHRKAMGAAGFDEGAFGIDLDASLSDHPCGQPRGSFADCAVLVREGANGSVEVTMSNGLDMTLRPSQMQQGTFLLEAVCLVGALDILEAGGTLSGDALPLALSHLHAAGSRAVDEEAALAAIINVSRKELNSVCVAAGLDLRFAVKPRTTSITVSGTVEKFDAAMQLLQVLFVSAQEQGPALASRDYQLLPATSTTNGSRSQLSSSNDDSSSSSSTPNDFEHATSSLIHSTAEGTPHPYFEEHEVSPTVTSAMVQAAAEDFLRGVIFADPGTWHVEVTACCTERESLTPLLHAAARHLDAVPMPLGNGLSPLERAVPQLSYQALGSMRAKLDRSRALAARLVTHRCACCGRWGQELFGDESRSVHTVGDWQRLAWVREQLWLLMGSLAARILPGPSEPVVVLQGCFLCGVPRYCSARCYDAHRRRHRRVCGRIDVLQRVYFPSGVEQLVKYNEMEDRCSVKAIFPVLAGYGTATPAGSSSGLVGVLLASETNVPCALEAARLLLEIRLFAVLRLALGKTYSVSVRLHNTRCNDLVGSARLCVLFQCAPEEETVVIPRLHSVLNGIAGASSRSGGNDTNAEHTAGISPNAAEPGDSSPPEMFGMPTLREIKTMNACLDRQFEVGGQTIDGAYDANASERRLGVVRALLKQATPLDCAKLVALVAPPDNYRVEIRRPRRMRAPRSSRQAGGEEAQQQHHYPHQQHGSRAVIAGVVGILAIGAIAAAAQQSQRNWAALRRK